MSKVIACRDFGIYFRCMTANEKVEIGNNDNSGLVVNAFPALHSYSESKNINPYSLTYNIMIRESEVRYRIGCEIPALAFELSCIKDNNDVYTAIDCLTDYTKTAIRENRLNDVEGCFVAAYELLHEGNRLIQLAVENTFVFAISRLLEVSLNTSQAVRALFLNTFKEEYCKQINSQHP